VPKGQPSYKPVTTRTTCPLGDSGVSGKVNFCYTNVVYTVQSPLLLPISTSTMPLGGRP